MGNQGHDKYFKRILSVMVIIICLFSFFTPLFLHNSLTEETEFGLSLLKETSLAWVTGILFYYFGEKWFKKSIKEESNPLK